MSVSLGLLDFSEEVLLQIAEEGLDAGDAIALAATCRALRTVVYVSRPFWMIIARNVSKIHPLPLPPFKTLETVNLEDLIWGCCHHFRLHRNLSRFPRPLLTGHSLLCMDTAEQSGIYHFAFLPGGRYVIVLLRNGTFSCWDTTWRDPMRSGAEGVNTVGRKVASYPTRLKPISWNFEMYPGRPEVMLVIVSLNREGNCVLNVFVLAFSDSGGVELTHICETIPPFVCDRIHIQEDIICATGAQDESGYQGIVLLDPYSGKSVCLDTGVSEMLSRFDCFPTSCGGIMLYREDETTAYTYCYNNIRHIIDQFGTIPSELGAPMRIMSLSPTSFQKYTFNPESHMSEHHDWFATHPWNTPNFARDNAVSIMSTSRAHGPRPGVVANEAEQMLEGPSYRTLTHHWFRGEHCADETHPRSGGSPPLQRWIHHIPDTVGIGVDHSEIICPGSHGTHILWIWGELHSTMNDEGQPRIAIRKRMQLAALPQYRHPSHPGCPSEIAVRDLDVDPSIVNLWRVATTDIEDSYGIIGLAMHPNQYQQNIITLLYY